MKIYKVVIFSLLAAMSSVFAETLFYIGDSHSVGPYGLTLEKKFASVNNLDYVFYGSCGAIADHYYSGRDTKCGYFYKELDGSRRSGKIAPTPIIKAQVEKLKPDYFVIEFGGNYRGYSEDFMRKDIRRLLDLVKSVNSKCIWVGNPDSRVRREDIPRLYKVLKEEVTSTCDLIESNKITQYPATGGDGIHYWGVEGTKQATKWAEAVFSKFLEIKN